MKDCAVKDRTGLSAAITLIFPCLLQVASVHANANAAAVDFGSRGGAQGQACVMARRPFWADVPWAYSLHGVRNDHCRVFHPCLHRFSAPLSHKLGFLRHHYDGSRLGEVTVHKFVSRSVWKGPPRLAQYIGQEGDTTLLPNAALKCSETKSVYLATFSGRLRGHN
jgi:hypothetical protein